MSPKRLTIRQAGTLTKVPVVMTDAQIEIALQDWWAESFPRAPINKQNAGNMVAFASHVLALAELYREYETTSTTND